MRARQLIIETLLKEATEEEKLVAAALDDAFDELEADLKANKDKPLAKEPEDGDGYLPPSVPEGKIYSATGIQIWGKGAPAWTRGTLVGTGYMWLPGQVGGGGSGTGGRYSGGLKSAPGGGGRVGLPKPPRGNKGGVGSRGGGGLIRQ